jgi:hypothetical protein
MATFSKYFFLNQSPNMCFNLKSKESDANQLRIFMDGLIDKFKISRDSSLYFPQVIYLKLDLIEEIFISLETNLKNSYKINFPIKIKIEKKHEAAESKGFKYASQEYDASFNIVISNEEDLKYAKSLLGLYKHLIQPYLKENKEVFRNISERSTRFLYIDLLHADTASYVGKTFSNTKTNVFMASAHHSMGPLENIDSFAIAHFRDRYRLGNSDKSIRRFNLDLNFFACYVKPMIEENENN